MTSLSNRTFQGFGLHPIVAQRLDQLYQQVDSGRAAVDALGKTAVTSEQVKTIAALSQPAIPSQSAQPTFAPVNALFVDGPVSTSGGTFNINKPAAFAGTLNAPTVADGTVLRIFSSTAFAHSITTTGLLLTGSAATHTALFAAHSGAGLVLMALAGSWLVVSQIGIAFS